MTEFVAGESVLRDLRRMVGDEGVFDSPSDRKAFSYDAGIYRVDPGAVVLPSTAQAASAVLRYAGENGFPLTLRSGGTNLGGGAIGPGIVMGMSRLLEMDLSGADEGFVEVGPGVILKELNDQLALKGYFFAPDPSSGLACQIGGMIGTNAAGAHALKYGAVKENVLALDFVPLTGNPVRLESRALDREIRDLAEEPGMPEAFRGVLSRLPAWAPVLRQHRRNVSKNSSGYNLFDLAERLIPEDSGRAPVWDPIRLVVGSEGTLGLVTGARLRVYPVPPRKMTILAFFLDLEDLGEAVAGLNLLAPSALEMLDRYTLDLLGRNRFGIPADADSMLLIEFDHEPQEELLGAALGILKRYPAPESPRVATGESEQKELWKARHALFPTLYRFDGVRRPLNFADDVAVPVHRLTELLAYLRTFFREIDIPVAIYGHIGNGNAHINPLLDLREPGAFDRLLTISRTIHRVVIEKFEGIPCGEHGEGRVRAEFLPEVYGPEVYRMFLETKKLFDPQGILNPGVKISRTSFLEHIDVERVSKPCATCGKCNTVCPSFDVLRQESMGARGWYQILTDPEFRDNPPAEVLDSCLNCKSCRAVCPAGVDVSSVILEARSRFRADPVTRAISRILIQPERLEHIASLLGRSQFLWDRPSVRTILERISRFLLRGVSSTASFPSDLLLPRIRSRSLRKTYGDLTEEGGRSGNLAYFHGCAANTLDDGVGESMIRLLSLGPDRLVLPRQTCSGTPIETYGHRDLARQAARTNLESLSRYPRIVTGCASCTLALKDLPGHFSEGSSEWVLAQEVSGRVLHLSQFMLEPEMAGTLEKIRKGALRDKDLLPVTYHASCHLRAAGVVDEPHRLLETLFGGGFRSMVDEDRCAGGAGTYLLKNPEFSKEIFGRKDRAIGESGAKTVTTGCPACQLTLSDRLRETREVRHLAVLLAHYLS
ncbi:MAG: FAD-binding and (Fe-S)-binding domain-containing protein [Leptospirales bacterium]